jgi:hypothetical protein
MFWVWLIPVAIPHKRLPVASVPNSGRHFFLLPRAIGMLRVAAKKITIGTGMTATHG